MIFKHLELTVTHDWGLWVADHEGSWKQKQLAYSDNQEGSRCFLYMVESLNLNSLAFFPTEESQPKHYSQWQVPLRTRAIHPQRGILFFIYNSRKETQYYWVGLKKKKRQIFLFRQLFSHVGQTLWFCNMVQSSKPDFKSRVPVSQLRLRTHKLARPSAVLCTYYLLLGQNLFKSACNSMKPQQLHLQTIWPTIFSSLVMLMQREKMPLL